MSVDRDELRRLAETHAGEHSTGAAFWPRQALQLLDRITELEAAAPVLEQVGWGGCDAPANCDEDGHEWDLVHEDGTGQLDDEHPVWPVYRIAAPVGAAGVPAGGATREDQT